MALKLEIGTIVNCPSDRGDKPYSGPVTHIDPTVNTNINGVKYQWVSVRHADGKGISVWPSHRLGHKVIDASHK